MPTAVVAGGALVVRRTIEQSLGPCKALSTYPPQTIIIIGVVVPPTTHRSPAPNSGPNPMKQGANAADGTRVSIRSYGE